ncbi:MAG: M28 family peptidase [Armatimonadetes bacterium]|nr:M28 family peptidase [Armatimonadota bacterium]
MKRTRRPLPLVLLLSSVLLAILAGCGGSAASGVLEGRAVAPTTATNLQAHVKMLSATIGNRSVSSYTGLTKAADYIAAQLTGAGCAVTRQTFTAGGKRVSNIVANLPCSSGASGIVLVGGHYDSDNNPGADDNASSVAICLELAKLLRGQAMARRVRIVAFVNEEDPWNDTAQQGALVCATSIASSREDLRAMINLDMAGYFTTRYRYALVGANAASETLAAKAVALFPRGTSLPTKRLSSRDPDLKWCDNGAFWKKGYQAILLSSPGYQYDPNYHSRADTWDKLNYTDMAELTKGLAAVVKGL